MNYLWIKFISMPMWLKLFCLVMIVLTVLKCFIKKEKDEKIRVRYRFVISLISIFTCLTGAYYLNDTLPSPASPQINQLFFYAQGNSQIFRYRCEFDIRNDGETPCELESVTFSLEGTEFTFAKSSREKIAVGGGGGIYGGGSAAYDDAGSINSTQSLSMIPQHFCIYGEGKNKDAEASNLYEGDRTVLITFNFKLKDKDKFRQIEPQIFEMPIIQGDVGQLRF